MDYTTKTKEELIAIITQMKEQNKSSKQLSEKKSSLNKKAEESFYESKNMLELVMDSIPQFIFWKDCNSVYIGCNENFAQVAGLKAASEIVGKTDYDLAWQKEEADFFVKVDQRVLETGKAEYKIIEPQLHADGKQAWLSTNKIPIRNERGEIIGILGTYEDITKQKQAELDLQKKNEEIERQNKIYLQINENLNQINRELQNEKKKSEEGEKQLKLIANNLINGMLYQVISIDDENRKITYISDTVEKYYGCSVEDAKNDASLIYKQIHPEDIDQFIKLEQNAIKYMVPFKAEARVFNPDGSIRWSYFVSSPRIIEKLVCWDGIEIDISDRKQLENELTKAKEQAEQTDHLKTAFLQNMSHEIRTPMNAIMGFSSLLIENFHNKQKLDRFSQIISQRCNDLLKIINDILDISKIESGQYTIHIEEYDLKDLYSELNLFYKEHRKHIGKEHIKLQLGIQNKIENTLIQTDKVKLKQILINLISNAFKFTEEGSIECGCQLKNKQFLFYVTDTGIGIQENKQKTVFERFMQADASTIGVHEGTGLGLAISKAFVTILQGEIWLESKPGKGSTFYFTLPRKLHTKL
ncbi:ATP-binding protein [Labilibaculum sp.]|uniref:sensor histidine kinase n=1 Tax=Labilibaculum sp. TaxID=2060723 RepID=UPI003561A903